VTINAPAPEVWDEVNDFDDLDEWHPAVAEAKIIKGGDDNKVGAQRLLTLGDGGTIKEELLAYDDAGMSYTYKILEGVLPVKNYESTISVESARDSESDVTWTGAFDAKGADDKTATDTIGSVYQAGLDNLKKKVETGD
jgi:mxaD protein